MTSLSPQGEAQTGRRRVLFVDDEQFVLDGFRDVLRPFRARWAMTFVSSGEDGLSALADEPSANIPTKAGPVSIGKPHVCTESYPITALQAHAEGTTTLSFTITTTGTVKDIKIAKSSGHKDLDDAASQCTAHWLYKPAEKDSHPVETPWKANVVWKIGEPPSVRFARNCLATQKPPISVPTGTGTTRLTFRVMADGSIKDVQLSGSSGSKALDEAGIGCAAKGHFDVTLLTMPAEGIAGHVEFDWAGVPPPPEITPPQRIIEPANKT